MKINLEPQSPYDLRSGYLNISSQPLLQENQSLPDHTQFTIGYFDKLQLPDNVVDQIIFNPSLNCLNPTIMMDVLKHWNDKLKIGGQLIIHFVDLKRVGISVFRGEIDLQKSDELLFGPNHSFNSVIDGIILQQAISSLGFKILSVNIMDHHTVLEVLKYE